MLDILSSGAWALQMGEMMSVQQIEVPDSNGFLRPRVRRGFLRALSGDDAGSGTATDLGIVRFLLSLEHLQARLYEGALEAGLLARPGLDVAGALAAQERSHAATLAGLIGDCGGVCPREPAFSFPADVNDDPASTFGYAAALEAVSAGALLGAASLIQDPDVQAVVQGIAGIEREHFVTVSLLLDSLSSRRSGPGVCPSESDLSSVAELGASRRLRGAG